MKRVITDETVAREHKAGRRHIAAPKDTAVVTPAAWSRARELGVEIRVESSAKGPDTAVPGRPRVSAAPSAPTPVTDPGSAERTVDKSGIIVTRGKSVRLGRFTGAGPGKNIQLTDLVTAQDGSPMTAGIMSFAREDAFPWTLDYAEVDLVLEGVLHIEIDGRTLEGRAGDVMYIPKGSRIVFGTPNRTKVFYVTWPADWQGAQAPRPQK